jgi:ABC-2 type transport system permease protein
MSSFGRLLRSELVKLGSLRSTYLILMLAPLVGIVLGVLDAASTAQNWASLSASDRATFDPVADSFSGFEYAQLALGALGVLVATGEYTTGTIGPTLTATPHRLRVYAAKAVTLTVVTVPICLACVFAAFLLAQRALSARHLDVSLGQPHALRAIGCAGAYMVVVTLVGFGLGAFIRHTAGALTLMVSLVFLAWPVARAVESYSYLPDHWLLVNAADALVGTRPLGGPNLLRTPSFSMACLELGAYLLVILGLGAWRASRDAW